MSTSRLVFLPALTASVCLCAPAVALAGPPDRVAKLYTPASNKIYRMTTSIDGELVAGVTTTGSVVVLDGASWEGEKGTPCGARSVAVQARSGDSGYFVYIGCDDGYVRTWRWNNGNFGPFRPYNGTADSADTAARALEAEVEEFEVASNPIEGLWLGGDGYLYALTEASGNVLRLHDLDPSTGVDDQLEPPIEFLRRDLKHAVIGGNFDGYGGRLYISHGGNDFSSSDLDLRSVLTAAAGATLAVSVDYMTMAPLQGGIPVGVYVADTSRGLYLYTGGQSTGQLNATLQIVDSTIVGLKSLVVTYDQDRRTASGLVVQDNQRIKTYPRDTTNYLGNLGDPTTAFDVDFEATGMVEGPTGYVIAGTQDGELAVLTDRPWIDELEVSPSSALSGSEVTVSFTPDRDGDWNLVLGGSLSGAAGDLVASGDDAVAGEEVTATIVVDGEYDEGVNELFVLFTESGTGLTGHRRTQLTVDNPPEKVSLTASHVGFGDRKLLLDFPALDAPDIASYRVYLSTEAFRAEDYETGGPDFVGSNNVTNPVVIAAPVGESRVTTEITKLTNEVTYYIGVRAVDNSGQEGPMSNVVTGRPRETNTAAKLVGEAGGPACAVGAGTGLGWLGAMMGVGMLARRRRNTVAAMVAALGAGLVGSEVAHAGDDPVPAVMRADSTPAWSSFEVGYDVMTVDQQGLRDVYGPSWGAVRLEAGPQLFRVFELDFGVGVVTKNGNTLDASGVASTEVARMTLLPLSMGATARIHILDEQPVVPFGSIGLDWVFFRENAVDADNAPVLSSRVTGSKNGWHWAAGANILLDLFAPTRASRLEAGTGINDTWLTLAYKRQSIGANDVGFDFSGWALYVGLKMDY